MSASSSNPSLLKQGYLKLREKEFREALAIFKSCPKTNPSTIGIIQCYVGLKEFNKAHQEKASYEFKTTEDTFHFYLMLYRLYLAEGNINEARKAYEKIPRLKEERFVVDRELAKCWEEFDSQNYNEALSAIQDLLQRYPQNIKLATCRSMMLSRLEQQSPSSKKSVKLDFTYHPQLVLAYLIEQGKAVSTVEEFEKAKQNFEHLIQLHPTLKASRLGYAVFLGRQKQFDKSFVIFKKLKEDFPFYWEGRRSYALMLVDADENDAAYQELLEILEANKKADALTKLTPHFFAEIYNSLAIINLNDGNTDLARKNAEKSIRFDSKYAPAYSTLGKIYKNLHQQQSQASDPGHKTKYVSHLMKSHEYFQTAEELDPSRFSRLHSASGNSNRANVLNIQNNDGHQTQNLLSDYIARALQQKPKGKNQKQRRLSATSANVDETVESIPRELKIDIPVDPAPALISESEPILALTQPKSPTPIFRAPQKKHSSTNLMHQQFRSKEVKKKRHTHQHENKTIELAPRQDICTRLTKNVFKFFRRINQQISSFQTAVYEAYDKEVRLSSRRHM